MPISVGRAVSGSPDFDGAVQELAPRSRPSLLGDRSREICAPGAVIGPAG